MYTTYDIKTGRITGTTNDIDRAQSEPNILGQYNASDYYIVNKQPVKYPPKPKGPSYLVYSFDFTNNSWVLDIPASDIKARQFRSQLFSYVDKVNPIWLASMNAVQQLQVANYRQDLLDITKQDNYPVDIVWPIVPYFLK